MGERSEDKGQKGPEKGADQQELWRGLVSAGGEILAEPGHCMAMQEGMGCPNKTSDSLYLTDDYPRSIDNKLSTNYV